MLLKLILFQIREKKQKSFKISSWLEIKLAEIKLKEVFLRFYKNNKSKIVKENHNLKAKKIRM
jgi:hypothetical protein